MGGGVGKTGSPYSPSTISSLSPGFLNEWKYKLSPTAPSVTAGLKMGILFCKVKRKTEHVQLPVYWCNPVYLCVWILHVRVRVCKCTCIQLACTNTTNPVSFIATVLYSHVVCYLTLYAQYSTDSEWLISCPSRAMNLEGVQFTP